jgi:PAS domain S-box-containing protein
MSMQFTLYLVPLFLASSISGALAIYTWRHRQTPGAIPFTIMMAALFEWGLIYILELAATDLPTKMLFRTITFIGVLTTPTTWFLFALEYTSNRPWITRQRLLLLSIMPLATFIMILTNESHGLFWATQELATVGPYLVIDSINGAGFWVHAMYSYILLLIGAILIIRNILRWPRQYRGQIVAVLLSLAAPWLANALTIFKILPIPIDLTPFAFTITGIGMAYALLRQRMLDLVPIARDVVIDSMKDGMIVIDTNDRIVDINLVARKILGITDEPQPIGEPLDETLGQFRHLFERYQHVTEAEDEIELEEGGKQRWYEFTLSPLRDDRNQRIGQLIITRDITERKYTEILLQESEARFRQIVENASDCIFRTDADGYFTYANPSVLHIMGFSNIAELLGKHYLELVAPGARHKIKRIYQRQFLSRTQNTYNELPIITADGREIWFGQNVQLISDGEQITGFQVLARDITIIKQAQEALRLAHDQALEASRVKSQLLSKVSHELRTPLGGILGFAELLQNGAYGELNTAQEQAMAEIIQSVNYLANMVGELLDEAQIEAKKTILQVRKFSPRELLRQAITGIDIQARKKGLAFTASIDPTLPYEMYGDERRLLQILFNLIGNAIKFTNQGFVTVKIQNTDERHWSIEVADSGIGVSEENQSLIFEPFHQAEMVLSPKHRGVGLGLSITRQLVELMGGRILLESCTGEGSTFHVILPIIKSLEANA